MAIEKTLVLLKPCTLQRALVGEIVSIFEKKGLHLCGMKMMQLTDELLSESDSEAALSVGLFVLHKFLEFC